MKHRLATSSLAGALAIMAAGAQAADLDISVENLTRGTYFTPLVVAAHTDDSQLFSAGQAASTALQAMAEGGDISGLTDALDSLGATQSNNPAGGLLAPGASTSTTLNTDGTSNVRLSVLGMVLPTNDGFVALNAQSIPTTPGTYTYYIKAWDAGTEANDEMRGSGAPGEPGFPVPSPLESSLGTGGSGLTTVAEGFVHIHRGVLGDTDSSGGTSDINSMQHRWLNPVAKVTLTVH